MLTINATAAKQTFGNCLSNVVGGPIIIEKTGKPAAVMVSYDEFIRLNELEDRLLLKNAIEAANEGFLDENESKNWFNSMNNKFSKIINMD